MQSAFAQLKTVVEIGGTGLWPVVLGVPLKTVWRRGLTLILPSNKPRMVSGEIRRDAGFDGRDARATNRILK